MIKLNIQRFASTNKTANYNLSQYIDTDKPSYLGDYNSDMEKIDSAMHTNATTISGVDAKAETAKTTADTALGNASAADTKATNAQSTATSALEKATSNEAEINKFNLVNFKEYNFTNGVATDAINTNTNIPFNGKLTVATNSDGSIFKLYGSLSYSVSSNQDATITLQNTGINPSELFDVSTSGLVDVTDLQKNTYTYSANFRVNSDGTITINESMIAGTRRRYYFPCLYFAKNFGDQNID